MSYQSDVEKALFSKLNTFATAQNLPVAWPNKKFTAPQTNYMRASILPAGTQTLGLEYDCTLDITGIFQIDLMVRKGIGSTEMRSLVDATLSEFRYGQTATSGALELLCQSVTIAQPLERGEHLAYPVSVTYRGFAANG